MFLLALQFGLFITLSGLIRMTALLQLCLVGSSAKLGSLTLLVVRHINPSPHQIPKQEAEEWGGARELHLLKSCLKITI